MPAAERVKLIRSLECVDAAVEALDDDRTCCKTVRLLVPNAFTNGGDQNNNSIPEVGGLRKKKKTNFITKTTTRLQFVKKLDVN